MKFLMLSFALLTANTALAQSAPPKNIPGWRQYFSNNTVEMYVDKDEEGKYYLTDGSYDMYPTIRYETVELANKMNAILNTIRVPVAAHAYQFNPDYDHVYFTYIPRSITVKFPGEMCKSFDYVAVRVNHATGERYISSSSNNEMLVGPFAEDDHAFNAREAIELYKFRKFCTLPGSNLKYFRP